MHSIRPLLAVIVSLVGTIFIVAFRRSPNLREASSVTTAAVKFSIVASMLPFVLKGTALQYTLVTILPGVSITFRADPFGMCFALIASFLWIITTFYSMGYMRSLNEHSQTRFFVFFALALFGALGVALAANLFTLYLFYEILSLSTYPLVTHHQDNEARISGRKYLTYLLGTSIAFQLLAIFLVYHYAGTLELTPGGIIAGKAPKGVTILIYFLFLFGFAKCAIMPLHAWLPAAMVAPTPVSALLHAVAVVKAGVFGVLRIIFFVFGPEVMASHHLGIITLYLASFTIIVGSLFALAQDNLKLRLAYSTISQLSYIILGAALLSDRGMTGGIIHIAMHAFGKITLFFCAGAILCASGKKNISDMKGIGRKMPFTMLAFFMGSCSVIGLPPFGGFMSKWFLALGCIDAEQYLFLGVILLSSLLNAAYFLPVVYQAFFGGVKTEGEIEPGPKYQEGPLPSVIALSLTAVGSLILI